MYFGGISKHFFHSPPLIERRLSSSAVRSATSLHAARMALGALTIERPEDMYSLMYSNSKIPIHGKVCKNIYVNTERLRIF